MSEASTTRTSGPTNVADASAPDVVAPPPGHLRFPLVDSLRGIAFLVVVLAHSSLWVRGTEGPPSVTEDWYGRFISHPEVSVAVFFLLSSFLLYRPFVAARFGARPIKIRDYAFRRALRILPAYWAILAILLLVPGRYDGTPGECLVAHLGFLQTYPIGMVGPECGHLAATLNQTWSLAVEVVFYAVLPLIVILMGTRSGRGPGWLRRELTVFGGICLLSVFVRFYAVELDTDRLWLMQTAAGTWLWVSLGLGLAGVSVAVQRGELRPDRLPRRLLAVVEARPIVPWATAVALYLGLCLILPPQPLGLVPATTAQWVIHYVTTGALGLLVVLPAVFGDARVGLPRRLLSSRGVAWIGLVSYSLFLWHYWTIFNLLDWGFVDSLPESHLVRLLAIAAATVALTAPVAAASYYLIERPFLRYKRGGLRLPGWLGGRPRAAGVPSGPD